MEARSMFCDKGRTGEINQLCRVWAAKICRNLPGHMNHIVCVIVQHQVRPQWS